ncbi:MAG: hypothetical protein K6E55_10650 [Thermoguttaceae bacterium]|nr:hypothetical protein [Thermoguttaceae bacterium]
MILTTKNYRVVCDRASRSLTIQRAVTWAPVSELRIPDDPELAEAVIKAVETIAGHKTDPAKVETPAAEPKPRAKKVNK